MATNLRGRDPRNKRIELRLSEAELETIELAAQAQNCPLAEILRAALRHYFEGSNLRFERGRPYSQTGGAKANGSTKKRGSKKIF